MIEIDEKEFKRIVKLAVTQVKNCDLHKVDDTFLDNLEDINGYGFVYIIYELTDNECKVKYIGMSKGGYPFKKRIKEHFISCPKGTTSKLMFIQKGIKNGNEYRLGYIKTKPESLRSLIEEELIKIYKEDGFAQWNNKGDKNI